MLRKYQSRIIESLRTILRSHRRPVVVAPTGSGKSVIATEIVKNCQTNHASTLFLAPRRELIYQIHAMFEEADIRSGIIMAGEAYNLYADHQIASFDTLHVRAIRKDKIGMPKADVVIVDEARLSMSKSKQEILAYYKDKIVIGLDATPARSDGTGLGEYYDSMVNEVSVRELMDLGYLVEPEYYAPSTYDLSGVAQTKSDYIVESLARAVDKPKLIGEIFDNWIRLAGNKRTVIFCTNRKHSRHVRDEFLRHGIAAEHVDGETPKDERKDIFNRVYCGKTQVLTNVFVASYGWDCPPVECCVIARPTKNIALYLQQAGRILRPFEGKEVATIIDHTGVVGRFGFLDDPIPWTLEGKDIRELKKEVDEERHAPKEIICTQCATIFSGQRDCPRCGHQLIPGAEDIPTKKADLVKVKRKNLTKDSPLPERLMFYQMLSHYGAGKGYKQGWASNKYRNKFGDWPLFGNVVPIPPNKEVLNYIKSRNIAYFAVKGRRNASAT